MKKIILSLILTLSIALTFYPMPVSAKSYVSGEDIEEELKNVDLTPYVEANKTDIITLSEVGFGTEDYKLIVYVYNATGNEFYKGATESNVINIATHYHNKNEPIGYDNLRLKYISSTQDNLIYKFSIIDNEDKIGKNARKQFVENGKRRYDIVGVQLLSIFDKLAKDFPVGKKYVYSGIDSLEFQSFDVLELEVYPVWYRTNSSNAGANYQHQLNAVYFSVPDDKLKDGYKLDAVRAEWYEYKTEAVIVVENKDLHSKLNAYKGVNVTEHKSDIPMLYYNEKTLSGNYTTHMYQWAYNTKENGIFVGYAPLEETEKLTFLFNKPTTEKVTSNELTDYIYSYSSSSDKGYLPIKNGKISADLFQDSVDEGRIKGYNVATIYADQKTDLLSYSDTATFWDKWKDYGLLSAIFGVNLPPQEDSITVTPIKQVNDDDVKDLSTINSNLLIDSSLCEDFKNFYDSQKNRTTFLFRFASTDYKAYPIDNPNDYDNKLGYVAWETVFLDFDIIHLEFYNGNDRLVVPVVADPIDVVPDVTPPPDWDDRWLLYIVITIIALLGIGAIYSVIKEGAN